jgi:hypothetical protein
MRVNFIALPHVGHGNSVAWNWVQLGGGRVIFMVAQFWNSRALFDHLAHHALRCIGSVQATRACATKILPVHTVP